MLAGARDLGYRLAVIASRSFPARRALRALVSPYRHLADRSGRVVGTADRLLSVVRVPGAYRRRSVAALGEFFFDVVDSQGVSLFVEAGAKEAAASQRALGLPGVRRAIAFEANPYTYRRFAGGVATTGVEYENLALDRGPGTTSFYVRLTHDGRPQADGQGSLHRRTDHPSGHEEVEIEADSLDRLVADRTDDRVAIWMDVEGATANVLDGAAELLDVTDALLVEVETSPFWAVDQWLVGDVVNAVAAHGLVPVARDLQSADQFNVVFVRRELLDDPGLAWAHARWRRSLG